jgi:RNA ligase (TIGR02306 family)
LIVEVVTIDEIRPHPDPAATRIELAIVKGWQTVVPVGKYKAGDAAIYVPPDAMIPPNVAEHWGVTNYLGSDGRVRCARLRGAMSFGFLAGVEAVTYGGFERDRELFARDTEIQVTMHLPQVGDDVAEYYGITKWEPGENFNAEMLEPEHPAFRRYTDIQLFENFPDTIDLGEEVVITEKCHGSNVRISIISSDQENADPFFVAGTHESQVRQDVESIYLVPLRMESVQNLLRDIYDSSGARSVIIFGEVYGWVQSLRYGHDKGKASFLAFDISVDGNFIDWDEVVASCEKHGVPMVPVLLRGPFDPDVLREMSGGNTVIGGDHIREGVVCHPVVEGISKWGDRKIVKRISDQYRLMAGKISDSH